MNKIKSEYQVLKFLTKQSEGLFAEDIAIKMRTAESNVSPAISSLKSDGYIIMKYQYKTERLSCPTYKISEKGKSRLREIRKERLDRAIALISVIATVAGTIAAFAFNK